MSNAQMIASVVASLSNLRGTLFTMAQVYQIVNGQKTTFASSAGLEQISHEIAECVKVLIDIFPDVEIGTCDE